tara:strand:+ start:109804 stop:111132 length:1329 start_codon:yes stop_codon:yes gene_type:complete
MKIAVIGTGYVGLVAGAGFADCGNDVVCVDLSEERIAGLQVGKVPFFEPGLSELVVRNVSHERLTFTVNIEEAVAGADAIFIAVGTPSTGQGADLSQVDAAARSIGRSLTGWAVIVNKSTVPVGTAARVRDIIASETKHKFSVASNPEFLKEGSAVNDFLKPDRVIVGCDDDQAEAVLRKIYAPLLRISDRFSRMDIASAELTKYAANAMLATRISFMNELALLAEKVGADIDLVRRGIGSDKRIGPSFLFAGAGFGGSCFPKDLEALAIIGKEHDVALSVVNATNTANQRQKLVLGERLLGHFGDDLKGLRIAFWGLAFKPGTDDIRESPAFYTIRAALEAGAEVVAYDPAAMENAHAALGDSVTMSSDMYKAVEGADALVMATEWHEFRRPSFEKLKRLMRTPVVFDGRNLWDPDEVVGLGFDYYGIGRRGKSVAPTKDS